MYSMSLSIFVHLKASGSDFLKLQSNLLKKSCKITQKYGKTKNETITRVRFKWVKLITAINWELNWHIFICNIKVRATNRWKKYICKKSKRELN